MDTQLLEEFQRLLQVLGARIDKGVKDYAQSATKLQKDADMNLGAHMAMEKLQQACDEDIQRLIAVAGAQIAKEQSEQAEAPAEE